MDHDLILNADEIMVIGIGLHMIIEDTTEISKHADMNPMAYQHVAGILKTAQAVLQKLQSLNTLSVNTKDMEGKYKPWLDN